MHISEGILSGPVLLTGGALTAAGTAVGLKTLDYDRIVHVGILSSAFFVASLIHVNIGPSSVHLVLNGIVGLLLGWGAFPAFLVGLALQALFFQFGGITTLGVNTVNFAIPALICHYVFRGLLFKKNGTALLAAFACGALAVLLSGVMMGLSLIFTEESLLEVAGLILAANAPVALIEGVITAFCIGFLKKVHPAMLPGYEKWAQTAGSPS